MKLIRYNYPEFTDLFSDFDLMRRAVIMNWNPEFTDLTDFTGFSDFVFQNSFSGVPAFGRSALADSVGAPGSLSLAADLFEDDANYYTRIELPGAKRDDLKVELENSILTIAYKRKSEADDESEAVTYKRSLRVPEGVEGDRVSASLKDGILTVTLPRAEKKAPKEVVIK